LYKKLLIDQHHPYLFLLNYMMGLRHSAQYYSAEWSVMVYLKLW